MNCKFKPWITCCPSSSSVLRAFDSRKYCKWYHLGFGIAKRLTKYQTSQHLQDLPLILLLNLATFRCNVASKYAQIESGPLLGKGSSWFVLRNHVSNTGTRNVVKRTIEPFLPHDIGDRGTSYLADAWEINDVAVGEEVGNVLVDLQQQQD